MAKKRAKKSKAKKEVIKEIEGGDEVSVGVKDPEQQIKMLIAKGKKKGFLTYEEMNDELPEDAVSASRLDKLLATLDEMGISLLDEADVDAQDLAKGDDDYDAGK